MADQLIKNKSGIPIARIKAIGGKLVIETINPSKILGRYDPKTNITEDHAGRKIGSGNLLTTLLPQGLLQRPQ